MLAVIAAAGSLASVLVHTIWASLSCRPSTASTESPVLWACFGQSHAEASQAVELLNRVRKCLQKFDKP